MLPAEVKVPACWAIAGEEKLAAPMTNTAKLNTASFAEFASMVPLQSMIALIRLLFF
jgi:hypothetical protein